MRTHRKVIICGLCVVMLAAAAEAAGPDAPTGAAAAVPTVRIGMVQTRAQVSQGTSAADLSNAVRDALISFMSGPSIQFVPLQSRIQIQVDAEAKQTGCEFVVFTALTEKKAQKTSMKGLAALMSAAAPLAALVPGAGSITATYAAHAAANAAETMAAQEAQQEAQTALSSAAQGTAHKDDEMSLEYKVLRAGDKSPVATKTITLKAAQDGEDILSPLVEQAANDILGALSN